MAIHTLFSAFHHDNVVPELGFDGRVRVHRLVHAAHGQGECSVLEGSHHGASAHPAQVSLQEGTVGVKDGLCIEPYTAFGVGQPAFWGRSGGSLTPCLALSSLYCAATSLKRTPAFSFSMASMALPCFSQRMCLTCRGTRRGSGAGGCPPGAPWPRCRRYPP